MKIGYKNRHIIYTESSGKLYFSDDGKLYYNYKNK